MGFFSKKKKKGAKPTPNGGARAPGTTAAAAATRAPPVATGDESESDEEGPFGVEVESAAADPAVDAEAIAALNARQQTTRQQYARRSAQGSRRGRGPAQPRGRGAPVGRAQPRGSGARPQAPTAQVLTMPWNVPFSSFNDDVVWEKRDWKGRYSMARGSWAPAQVAGDAAAEAPRAGPGVEGAAAARDPQGTRATEPTRPAHPAR